MSLAFELVRGQTEAIILACLDRGDSYGYQINKDIGQITGGCLELKEATLYTAFRRLEECGFISSYWGAEKVGARRRYYSITGAGRDACERYRAEWAHSKDMLDKLLAVP